jgi:hypothetical protein
MPEHQAAVQCEALELARRLAEAADLLEGAVEAGDVPGEVLAALLPDLRRLAEGAEAALATAEGPCVSRSRSFFPPGCKTAARRAAGAAAEAAAPPAANKPDQPDPRRVP